MQPKLGIVAGGGDLPARLIALCRAQGRAVFVLALKDQADESLLPPDVDREWIALGEGGRGIDILHAKGVQDLVLVGAVRRPSLLSLAPDWRTARLIARVGFRALGDDGLLRAVVRELESEGFRVIGVHALLGDLLAPAGVWGRVHPGALAKTDIAAGLAAARALGAKDIGQAVVIQQGVVLAMEGAEGTDALIRRAAKLRRSGAGPVLVKTSKPGQERRVDLPTIGPATIAAAIAGGFAGIAVEAGSTLVVDRESCIAEADRAGLFLVGMGAK